MSMEAAEALTPVPADVTVLMYHGVRRAGFPPDAESDPVYELMQGPFARQLDYASAAGVCVTSLAAIAGAPDAPREGRGLVFSFDDGILCHADVVVPMLLDRRRGFTGEFFVVASKVGTPGYISWDGLRDMAAEGMSIQSHGYTHRYLTDLSERQVAEELERAKRLIEDKLGRPVTVFAAPGGRITPALAMIAHGLGHRLVCGSRPGYFQPDRAGPIVPRMAVRRNTDSRLVRDWIRGSRGVVWRQAARYQLLHATRSVLGNALYERVRNRYLGQATPRFAGQGRG